MAKRVLALDYDGTIATHGRVQKETWEALGLLRSRGWGLLLATGRIRADLERVCDGLALFDGVVAENGALVFVPGKGEEQILAEAPPAWLFERMKRMGMLPIEAGRVVVATLGRYEARVRELLAAESLKLVIIANKESIMLLPEGVGKSTGIDHFLRDWEVGWSSVVGVGDAENDVEFLGRSGRAVAVSNAKDDVKAIARLVTRLPCGAGVRELVRQLLDEG